MGVFAKRDLMAGDKVSSSYFEEDVGHRLVQVRRKYLQGRWVFESGCNRCINEAAYWDGKHKSSAFDNNKGVESKTWRED